MANLVEVTEFVFNNFAVGVDEVMIHFKIDEPTARMMLTDLAASRIVTDHLVNGEDEVWQTWKTYDDNEWEDVEADLFEAYECLDLFEDYFTLRAQVMPSTIKR